MRHQMPVTAMVFELTVLGPIISCKITLALLRTSYQALFYHRIFKSISFYSTIYTMLLNIYLSLSMMHALDWGLVHGPWATQPCYHAKGWAWAEKRTSDTLLRWAGIVYSAFSKCMSHIRMVSSDMPVLGTYRASLRDTKTRQHEWCVPIRREGHGKYAFNVTVKDYRCLTCSQVPHTANGIKTAVNENKCGFMKSER